MTSRSIARMRYGHTEDVYEFVVRLLAAHSGGRFPNLVMVAQR